MAESIGQLLNSSNFPPHCLLSQFTLLASFPLKWRRMQREYNGFSRHWMGHTPLTGLLIRSVTGCYRLLNLKFHRIIIISYSMNEIITAYLASTFVDNTEYRDCLLQGLNPDLLNLTEWEVAALIVWLCGQTIKRYVFYIANNVNSLSKARKLGPDRVQVLKLRQFGLSIQTTLSTIQLVIKQRTLNCSVLFVQRVIYTIIQTRIY